MDDFLRLVHDLIDNISRVDIDSKLAHEFFQENIHQNYNLLNMNGLESALEAGMLVSFRGVRVSVESWDQSDSEGPHSIILRYGEGLVEVNGFYDSWDGVDWRYATIREVERREVVNITYEYRPVG